MCVVSMIADHFREKWDQPWRTNPTPPRAPFVPEPPAYPPFFPVLPPTPNQEPPITDEEIREFRELLRRARKYDRENNQPDCETEQKLKDLLELAEKLGVRDKIQKALEE